MRGGGPKKTPPDDKSKTPLASLPLTTSATTPPAQDPGIFRDVYKIEKKDKKNRVAFLFFLFSTENPPYRVCLLVLMSRCSRGRIIARMNPRRNGLIDYSRMYHHLVLLRRSGRRRRSCSCFWYNGRIIAG